MNKSKIQNITICNAVFSIYAWVISSGRTARRLAMVFRGSATKTSYLIQPFVYTINYS